MLRVAFRFNFNTAKKWIPAFAGMTETVKKESNTFFFNKYKQKAFPI